jgi:hypothetical protein
VEMSTRMRPIKVIARGEDFLALLAGTRIRLRKGSEMNSNCLVVDFDAVVYRCQMRIRLGTL